MKKIKISEASQKMLKNLAEGIVAQRAKAQQILEHQNGLLKTLQLQQQIVLQTILNEAKVDPNLKFQLYEDMTELVEKSDEEFDKLAADPNNTVHDIPSVGEGEE